MANTTNGRNRHVMTFERGTWTLGSSENYWSTPRADLSNMCICGARKIARTSDEREAEETMAHVRRPIPRADSDRLQTIVTISGWLAILYLLRLIVVSIA
jgi:hypothetical protein